MNGAQGAYTIDPREMAKAFSPWVSRVLHVNCGNGLVGGMLKRHRGVDEVHGIEDDAHAAALAAQLLDSVIDHATKPRFPPRHFDALLVTHHQGMAVPLAEVLARFEPYVAVDALVLVVCPNSEYVGSSPWRDNGYAPPEVDSCASRAGFKPYQHHGRLDECVQGIDVLCTKEVAVDGQRYEIESPRHLERLFAPNYAFQLVHKDYDPLAHAQQLGSQGHPDWAFDVLAGVPPECQEEPEVAAHIVAQLQRYLLEWDEQAGRDGRLARFLTSQCRFYEVISKQPLHEEVYVNHAEFWRRVGDDDMAARLLRSLHHVAPSEKLQAALKNAPPSTPSESAEPPPPEWRGMSSPLRMLVVVNPRPHYGVDILYDGLCALCGDENVVEYPWKPSLHGIEETLLANYPCTLHRRGNPMELDEVIRALRQGAFDLVLYGDLEFTLPTEAARRIGQAAKRTPLFILDAEDDAIDHRKAVLDCLGLERAEGYFKREMLQCVDYGPGTFPFPFAFLDDRIPEKADGERDNSLFWAGHRDAGLRSLYLEHVERLLGTPFDKKYTPQEYREALLHSRIGLNIFGWGYDTVRYWELPAHGCMLLSERPPFRIPHNFEDGVSALFFDDTKDLEEKLGHYIGHPQECAAIARAGREHLLQYHTASARARQVLGWIEVALAAREKSP